MANIPLNVLSYGNKNITTYVGSFTIAKISDLKDNLNLASVIVATEVGDTNNVMSDWAIDGNIREGQVMYWSVETVTGTTRRVRLYSNAAKTNMVAEGTMVIANNANNTVFLTEIRESGISGSVLLTIGASLVDDTDVANTLTFTVVTAESNLQLIGASQFMYTDGVNHKSKVTVLESVVAVQALMNA